MRTAVVLLVAGLAACTQELPDVGETTRGLCNLPEPKSGLQLQVRREVEALGEFEMCQFVQLPHTEDGSDYWINEVTTYQSIGSHHVIAFTTLYDRIPRVDLNGKWVDTSKPFPCPFGPLLDWEIDGYIGTTQKYKFDQYYRLPEDTAVRLKSGAVLLFDVHHLNVTTDDVHACAQMNLKTVPEEQVVNEADLFLWYDPYVYLPPQAKSVSRMSCPVNSDMYMLNLQNHMHAQGNYAEAVVQDENREFVEQLYETKSWSSPETEIFTPAKKINAGSFIEFRCEFENPREEPIIQGPTFYRDEMCTIFGVFYPVDNTVAGCGPTAGPPFWWSWGVHYPNGHGDQTCQETMECINAAENPKDDAGWTLYPCVSGTKDDETAEAVFEWFICDGRERFDDCKEVCGCPEFYECFETDVRNCCDSPSPGESTVTRTGWEVRAACDECLEQACRREREACAAMP